MCLRLRRLPVDDQLHPLRSQELSLEEISAAWAHLAHLPSAGPLPPLPPALKHLSPLDWHLLHNLLLRELEEKDSSPLH